VEFLRPDIEATRAHNRLRRERYETLFVTHVLDSPVTTRRL
jgi:hypothetical protein